jgi:hypothetical protein
MSDDEIVDILLSEGLYSRNVFGLSPAPMRQIEVASGYTHRQIYRVIDRFRMPVWNRLRTMGIVKHKALPSLVSKLENQLKETIS